MTATVTRITGSLAEAEPLRDAALYDLVRVGPRGLLGEIIRFSGPTATLQLFEDTTGLEVGAEVTSTGASLIARLGPGLLGSVLDGVGRPLAGLAEVSGDFIAAGATAPMLDVARRWTFRARVHAGDVVGPGDVLGDVEERPGFEHRILVPHGVSGTVESLASGTYTVDEPIGRLRDGAALWLAQRWPIRTLDRSHGASPPIGRWSPASGSSICCSRSPRVERSPSQVDSAPARRSSSTRWRSTPTRTWSCSWGAASEATRWPRFSTTSRR